MKNYKTVEVSEKQLEDLVRQGPGLIEEGLEYVDHQVPTDRGPLDVLIVDSGGALVIVELKVVEDDTILVQGIDYYDYVFKNKEGFGRIYKDSGIKPEEEPRLFLISPSFSQPLINRCKWINMPISLYTFKCIKLGDGSDIIPVFTEINVPEIPKPPPRKSLNEILEYITDDNVRKTANDFLTEVKNWDKNNILIDPIQGWVSMKYKGRVFAYLGPRRRFFVLQTIDQERNWSSLSVNQDSELSTIRNQLRTTIEKL